MATVATVADGNRISPRRWGSRGTGGGSRQAISAPGSWAKVVLDIKGAKYFRPSELVAWIAGGRVATAAETEAKAVTHVLNNPVSPWGNRNGGKRK